MQPYQSASEEMIRQQREPERLLRKGIGTAAATLGTLGGAGIAARAMPLLNKLIPSHLAAKGLGKIDPRFGKFLDGVMKTGVTIDQALDFLRDKFNPDAQNESAIENRNIIEQYSPELNQFIQDQIQRGRSPIQAGAIAQTQAQFNQAITQMTKDHKMPWSNILQTVFGGQQQTQPQQPSQMGLGQPQVQSQQGQQQMQPQQGQQQMQPQQGQQQMQPQQGQQQGAGDQQLLAALQKILQM